jgi:hypothetical protein
MYCASDITEKQILNIHGKAYKKKAIIYVMKSLMMYYLERKRILLIILNLDTSMDL